MDLAQLPNMTTEEIKTAMHENKALFDLLYLRRARVTQKQQKMAKRHWDELLETLAVYQAELKERGL